MKERELFLAALDIEDPAARQAHLRAECASDAELLARVESLLSSHEGQSQFLNTPVVEQIADVSEAGASATIVYENGSTHDDDPDATTFYSHGTVPMTKHQDDAEFEMALGYLEPSSKPDSLGRLGHYEVLEVIGRGAFGTVLRAFDEKLQRVVAIKVMAPEMAATSPARKRFLREAQASAAIRHEHVVSVYAVEEKPLPYLVMEFIPGQTLQQRLDQTGPLDVPTVLRLGRQIAEGLAAAHAQDLIHRDIKPANILLETGAREMVKVTDFGLARAADDASLTQSGTIAGTPMYMAPEQALGHKLDQRADLFSFGSVLYQMVSGRAPFRAPTMMAVLKRVAEDTPRPIREIIPETPQWLCDIITKLHAKNPDERYQTAQEIADVLANCEAQLKEHAGLKDLSRIPQTKSASSPKWKLFTVGGVVGAMLLLGVVIITLTNKDGTKTSIKVPEGTNVSVDAGKDGRVGITVSGRTDTAPSALDSQYTGWHGWPADAPKPAIAPFDAAQAKQHQEAWAKHLGVPVEYTNSIGMRFVLIPPGEFTMGSTAVEIEAALKVVYPTATHWHECIRSEAPQHKVILTQPTYLGIHEVTQAEYEKVMGTNPSHFAPNGTGKEVVAGMDTSNHPIEKVSWNDAVEFCAKLSQQEKLKPSSLRDGAATTQLDGTGYRLPSEAEWEFACRAGTTTKYWIGDKDEDLERAGWFGANSGDRTHAAGELKANPFGLFDIHGNVWEWVQDVWVPGFYGEFAKKPAINPSSPSSSDTERVVRGGRWYHSASYCRSSTRLSVAPTDRFEDLGFRVSLSVDAVKAAIANRTPMAQSTNIVWRGWPDDAPKPAIAPFADDQARAHQEAWAKHLGVPVETENSIGMKFRLIPPGEFLMGSTTEEIEAALQVAGENRKWQEHIRSEGPQHKVVLTKPIYVGVTEVTQSQYEQVMGTNPSDYSATGKGKDVVADLETGTLPVEMVSWNEAAEFCAKLSQQQQMKPFNSRVGGSVTSQAGTGYRLPSEAEWEFACRAGTVTRFWAGDEQRDLFLTGWFTINADRRTHATGKLKANPFGLSDMHGNVGELVQDGWDSEFFTESQEHAAIDPMNPYRAGSLLVVRGGWLWNDHVSCSSSTRSNIHPLDRFSHVGFRVVLVVGAVPATEPPTTTDRAVSFVELLGGKVFRDDNSPGKPVTRIDLAGTQVTDAGLQKLASLTNLGMPVLSSTQVTDAGLKELAPLTKLGRLDLTEVQVSDAGLKELASLTNLKLLDLRNTKVTDAGVEELQKALPTCQILK